MTKFVSKKITAIKGKQEFRQMIVLEDNQTIEQIQKEIDEKESRNEEVDIKGVLDEYEENLESKYQSNFRSILSNMDRIANLMTLSKAKFRDITPEKESVKEYEFKLQDLRIYAIKIQNGQMVILGGFKNNQKDDIRKFRALKKKYLLANQKS